MWVTTATEDGRELSAVCVDRETGRVLVDKRVFDVKSPRPLGNAVNTYATPSPVIEPGRVYVNFGSYGTACLDTATFDVLWTRRDLPCDHWRGPGSSPALFEDLLLLHMDGINVQYAAALDKTTGDTRWVTFRSADYGDLEEDGRPIRRGDFRKAFNSPYVIEYDGQSQMVSPGAKAVYSYDVRTGNELWKVCHDKHSSAPRTLYSNGIAYVSTGLSGPEILAVRVNGRGDVTDSHVAWRCARGVPSRSSPVLVDGRIYMVSEDGIASSIDARDGREIWRHRIGGRHSASAVYADGRIHFFDESGTATIIRPGESCEILAQNQLDDGFMASPAIAGKALFLRTKTHLYRVEKRPE